MDDTLLRTCPGHRDLGNIGECGAKTVFLCQRCIERRFAGEIFDALIERLDKAVAGYRADQSPDALLAELCAWFTDGGRFEVEDREAALDQLANEGRDHEMKEG